MDNIPTSILERKERVEKLLPYLNGLTLDEAILTLKECMTTISALAKLDLSTHVGSLDEPTAEKIKAGVFTFSE